MTDFAPILKFLKDLAKHNDRAWFEKNKPKYLEVKLSFEGFVGDVLEKFQKFDETLIGLDPKKLSFRIYRDVRFSKDKKPYKTNMAAGFSPNGKAMQQPGYYLHIEPGNKSMIAGGLYMPEPERLAKIRQEIDYNIKGLKKIFSDKKFKGAFGDFDDSDKLKLIPKGYAKDHPEMEWLKLKSFIVVHHFSDKEVVAKHFLKHTAAYGKLIKPLNAFLSEAVQ
jgi:uncharacterized protein (TIGR02453 family)